MVTSLEKFISIIAEDGGKQKEIVQWKILDMKTFPFLCKKEEPYLKNYICNPTMIPSPKIEIRFLDYSLLVTHICIKFTKHKC